MIEYFNLYFNVGQFLFRTNFFHYLTYEQTEEIFSRIKNKNIYRFAINKAKKIFPTATMFEDACIANYILNKKFFISDFLKKQDLVYSNYQLFKQWKSAKSYHLKLDVEYLTELYQEEYNNPKHLIYEFETEARKISFFTMLYFFYESDNDKKLLFGPYKTLIEKYSAIAHQ